MKPGAVLAILLLSLIAVAHALRLAFAVEVVVGSIAIPMWGSAVGLAVSTLVAGLLWRETRPSGRGP